MSVIEVLLIEWMKIKRFSLHEIDEYSPQGMYLI